jgi:hypothetical protein
MSSGSATTYGKGRKEIIIQVMEIMSIGELHLQKMKIHQWLECMKQDRCQCQCRDDDNRPCAEINISHLLGHYT